MQVPHHIHWHIMPFAIASVIVCLIGVLAHAYWPRQEVSPSARPDTPSPAYELQDDTTVREPK